jgi:predicted transcriptional regulator
MNPESNLPRIGDLQLRILKELWHRGSASVHEVHAAINPGRPLAYTTIATMLRKMEDRGLVCHRTNGRTFVYRPLLKAEDVSRSAGRHFVEQIFEGSLLGAVSHLLKTCDATPEELSQLEKAVAEAKRRAK